MIQLCVYCMYQSNHGKYIMYYSFVVCLMLQILYRVMLSFITECKKLNSNIVSFFHIQCAMYLDLYKRKLKANVILQIYTLFSKLNIVLSVIEIVIEVVIKFFVRCYVNFLPLTLALSPINSHTEICRLNYLLFARTKQCL